VVVAIPCKGSSVRGGARYRSMVATLIANLLALAEFAARESAVPTLRGRNPVRNCLRALSRDQPGIAQTSSRRRPLSLFAAVWSCFANILVISCLACIDCPLPMKLMILVSWAIVVEAHRSLDLKNLVIYDRKRGSSPLVPRNEEAMEVLSE
jgi:hypothetical protein